MKGLLFFLVLFGLAFIAWSVSVKDGFQNILESDTPSILPNTPLISPRYQTLTKGAVMPFTEASAQLLTPPPGQTASVMSLPPEDPANQKASAPRIQSVYESLVGFFTTDAAGLQKLGDSSVQLPLTTAKSDMGRLKDELSVLNRNPGLESTLTTEDINGVEANLGYLQKKWRLSVNARSGAPSPMLPEEGFSDCSQRSTYGWFRSFFGGNYEGFQVGSGSVLGSAPGSVLGSAPGPDLGSDLGSAPGPDLGSDLGSAPGSDLAPGSVTGSAPGSVTGSVTGSGSGSGSGSSRNGSGTGIKLADLQDLSLKLSIEIVRLKGSGATDANTQSRISVLTAIKQNVDDLIADIKSGIRTIESVPLTKADIAKFLPAVSNPNTALPDLLNDFGLKSVLSSLFPNYALGDISGAEIAKKLFDTYMKDMSQNLSWEIGLNYKGQAEQDIAANYASAMKDARYAVDNTGTPTALNSTVKDASNAVDKDSSGYRGIFESVVSSVTGKDAKVSVGRGGVHKKGGAHGAGAHAGGEANEGNTTSGPFDWKERSTQICNQISARGMKAYDFGCLKEGDKIKDNFSWRGYTRMVCTRLGTVYDPSVPELCGCPPPSWIGWRP